MWAPRTAQLVTELWGSIQVRLWMGSELSKHLLSVNNKAWEIAPGKAVAGVWEAPSSLTLHLRERHGAQVRVSQMAFPSPRGRPYPLRASEAQRAQVCRQCWLSEETCCLRHRKPQVVKHRKGHCPGTGGKSMQLGKPHVACKLCCNSAASYSNFERSGVDMGKMSK